MTLASTYFYDGNDGEKQTLHRRIRPSDAQFNEQQDRWNALKEFLLPKLEASSGYPMRTWLQGSYKFGTQIRPVRSGDEFDIDLGAYYCWAGGVDNGEHRPKELKAFVQNALHEFARQNGDVKSVAEPPKPRCCRVHFDGAFHIDVPCYHLDADADTRDLATEDDRWEQSDPKALYKWFTSTFDDALRERVRRLIRYTKAWALLKLHGEDNPPSSVLLTVLVANAVIDGGKAVRGPEDEAFAEVIRAVRETVLSGQGVRNPVDNSEDLAARMDSRSWRTFVDALGTLHELALTAVQCETDVAACATWAGAFEHLFPLPDAESITEEARRLPALRAVPEISVRAQSPDNPAFVYSGTNEIGPIRKNCDITFDVTNASQLPVGTRFEWTVRNAGAEAENINDLGHRAESGPRASERSAYNGTHYMDCVALVGNRIVGVRRAKVIIRGEPAPRRNPAKKPRYVALRGRR